MVDQAAYAFRGFRPLHTVRGVFRDPKARVITLVRRSKKTPVGSVVVCTWAGTTERVAKCAITRLNLLTYTLQTM